MNLQETVLTKLTETFPDKTFAYVMEVDPISYKPWARLTVNGKATVFGYQVETVVRAMEMHKTSLEDMANEICRSIVYAVRSGLSVLP